MTHRLLDGMHREVRLLSEKSPLLGVIAEHLHRRGELAACRIGARHQNAECQHP